MARRKLTEQQVKNLKKDKDKGMNNSELMKKYNVTKMTIYNTLNRKANESEAESEAESESSVKPSNKKTDDENEESEFDEDYLKEITGEVEVDVEEKEPEEMVDKPKSKVLVRAAGKTRKEQAKEEGGQQRSIIDDVFRDGIFMNSKPERKIATETVAKKKSPSKLTKSHKKEDDDEDEKIKLILKIENYCKAFTQNLSTVRPISKPDALQRYIMSLSRMSNADLTRELELIRMNIGRFKSYDTIKLGYMTVVDGIERSGKLVGFDLDGYKHDVEENRQIDDVIKELSCEYSFDKYLDPKVRLLGLSAFQLMSTSKKNKLIKQQQDLISKLNMPGKTVDPELVNKYSDI